MTAQPSGEYRHLRPAMNTPPDEVWRRVPDTQDHYEVSNRGRVRKHYASCVRIQRGWTKQGGYYVQSIDGRPVLRHVLVARAFHGEPQPGQCVRHLNGVAGDDRLENLAWGTLKENAEDSIRHGTNYALNKTHCKHGHEFTEANTWIDNLGRRICRTCQARHRKELATKLAAQTLAAKAERFAADPTRQVIGHVSDGSSIVRYGKRPRYVREWPLAMQRKRVKVSAAEARALLNEGQSA